MIRNWDIVRLILEKIEQNKISEFIESGEVNSHVLLQDDANAFLGHVEILLDAGIIKNCVVKRDANGDFCQWDFRGVYISMQGHDLLDVLRDAKVWNKIKANAKRAGVKLSWEFIKASIPLVLSKIASEYLGI